MPGCQRTQVYALQRVRGRLATWAAFLALLAAPAGAQTPVDAARQLYNQGRYDAAAELAARLRTDPVSASPANLVLGRCHLERFRQSSDRAHLVAARQALCEVKPAALGAREQAEYLVGLGESLFLGESYGAAAALFLSAFDRSQELGPRGFDRVFDWWATSLDRLAQAGLVQDPEPLYLEIVTRAQDALTRTPGAGSPAYWMVVANRSLGNMVRAWDGAIAGWVRAPLTDDHGVALRADLDRLVLQAIIPERARQLALADHDRERAAAMLRATWEDVKKEWSSQ